MKHLNNSNQTLNFDTLFTTLPSLAGHKVACAVSGGVDSMVLCYLFKKWSQLHSFDLMALTVDHGLRRESFKEAEAVSQWLKDLDISHTILRWDGEKPTKNIQETARQKRYELLSQWCHDHAFIFLATAHHLNDQFETFFMRLRKGSGLKGLGCMPLSTPTSFGHLIRPLLSISRETILDFAKAHNIPYIEDPSNNNNKYERVRWRQLTPLLSEQGLTPHTLLGTINKLQRTQNWIDSIVADSIQKATLNTTHNEIILDFAFLKSCHDELAVRTLSQIIFLLGKSAYPPSDQAVYNLWGTIKQSESYTKTTLGHCLIIKKGSTIIIQPEPLRRGHGISHPKSSYLDRAF